MNPFPDVDPTAYLWERSDQPLLWRRRALGPEFPWILKPKEYRQIFVAGDLTLESPVPCSVFAAAVETAWIVLRLEIPDVAVCPQIEDSSAYLQYEPLKTEAEVESWLRRTAFIDYGSKNSELKELREKIVRNKAGQDSDSTFLLVSIENEEIESPVSRCQVLLNVDHRITDGIGARIIFGKYLSLLASSLANPWKLAWDEDAWKQSINKLSQPWISAINEEQVICGPDYQESVAESKSNLDKLVNTNPKSLHFPMKQYKI
jgi:hypothetical protein